MDITVCMQEITLPKAQWTQGLSALTKVFAFISYLNLINIQLQNRDQTSASKYRPNASLKVLTKLWRQNLEQISASFFNI